MRNKKSIKKVGGYSDPFGVQDIFKPKQYPPVYQAKNTMYAGVEPKVQATSDQLWGNVDADEQDNKFNSTPSYLRPQATYGMIGPPEPIQPNYGPIGPFETRYDNGLRNDCPEGQKWSEEDQRCMDDNGYDPAQHEEKNKPSRDPLSRPKTGPGTGVNPNSQISPAEQSRKNAFDPTLYLRGAQAGLTWLGNKMEMNRQDQYTRENIAKLGQPNAMPVDNYQPNYYNLYAKYGGKVKMQKGGFNMPPAVGDNTRLPLPIDPNAIPLPQGTNPNVTVYATKDKTTSDYLNTLTHKNFTRDYPLVPGENIPEVNSFEEFNPDYYQDTWQAWLQNGKPRIRPLDSSKEGRSYYRPPANQIQRLFNKNGTNEMHLNYKKTKSYAVRDAYLAELAHAQQTKMGIYSKDRTKWQTKAEYDAKAYSDPTSHEYQAHQIIEPKLRQRYENRHSLISPSTMDSLVNAYYSFKFGEFTKKDQEDLLNKKLGRIKYQDGGAIQDYYKQYMNSPMYKKMNEGKQDFTSERTSQLNKLTTKLVPQSQIADNFRASNPGVDIKNSQMQGYYNFNDSTINLNNKRDFRGKLPMIEAHEYSHGVDGGGKYIPQQDVDMLKSSDPNFGALEGRALLNQTRWEAKKSGMYDPFTQPFKSEYLQDKKNNGLRNLKKQYSDDQILNLMNSVSSADQTSLPIAQKGGSITDDVKRQRAKKVVELAESRISNNSFVDVPDNLKKIAESRDEEANSCIGGVCTILKDAGAMDNVNWSNTDFALHAKDNGFPNKGYGVKGLKNLEPGDVLQHSQHQNKQNHYYPSHAQIYLGQSDDGEYRFFDNYNKKEKKYKREDLEGWLDPKRTNQERNASIYKVNPFVEPDGKPMSPEAIQALKDRNDVMKYNLNTPSGYKYNIRSDAKDYDEKTKPMMDRFVNFANDEEKINELVRKTGKSKEEIHDSLLNVFGTLGQENKWQDRTFAGSGLGLEGVYEKIFKPKNKSIGPGQIRFNSIPKNIREQFNINNGKDLYNMEKVIPLMAAMDLDNKTTLENWGKNNTLSEKLIGKTDEESPLRAEDLRGGVGRWSPYLRNQYSSISKNKGEKIYKLDEGSYPDKVYHKTDDNLERKIISSAVLYPDKIKPEEDSLYEKTLQNIVLRSKSQQKPVKKMGGFNRGKKYPPAEPTEVYQKGGRTPITVTDKNDPRLKAYQDSLSAYNSGNRNYNNFKKTGKNEFGNPVFSNTMPLPTNVKEKHFTQEEFFNFNVNSAKQRGASEKLLNEKIIPMLKKQMSDIDNDVKNQPIGYKVFSNNLDGQHNKNAYDFNGFNYAISQYKKPVQPVVYKPEPKDYPIVTRPKAQVRGTISGGDMSPDTSSTGDPIFGPTQSLIGHWKDGQFYSADGAQGKVNQADVDLLKDPVALNKYLKSKGLPVKKLGGFNRGKK